MTGQQRLGKSLGLSMAKTFFEPNPSDKNNCTIGKYDFSKLN